MHVDVFLLALLCYYYLHMLLRASLRAELFTSVFRCPFILRTLREDACVVGRCCHMAGVRAGWREV
jgi:hypothetical protein